MTLFLVGLALILAGGVAATAARHGAALYQALVLTGSALAVFSAGIVLVSGRSTSLAIEAAIPGGAWHFGVDGLSAVFLMAILGVGAACAVFGTHAVAPGERPSGVTQFAFAVLLAAIALVVAARSVISFLVAWEVMAIASYVLIVTHHEEPEVRRAGLIYLVATHTATLALFALFATWQTRAADWSFGALAAAAPSLSAGAQAAILLLALVGFGFKAGSVPFHFWLPPAHSAAPSHVSALMSGIVIKTGIYGLLRVLVMLGRAPEWWGWLVLAIGVASAVLGVLWALAQHDIKRLLAYHSVENIGIILMGIGAGVVGVAHASPVMALLGFAGALLHTVNHALFKSVLFLGAGSAYLATGTRNIEELGGLARRMPWTWLGFLIGAAAIIGVPPFNGFVSEWLVYQALYASSATSSQGGPLRLALLGMPALALTGALALACFAKVAGVAFLGEPRTSRARDARETSVALRAPLLALAGACVALGLLPTVGISVVVAPARRLAALSGTAIPASVAASAWLVSLVAIAVIALAGGLWLLRQKLSRSQVVRADATWACGYDAVTPRMQYTASSFASPLLAVFGGLSGVRVHRTPASLRTHAIDLVLDAVAVPLWHALHRAAVRLRAVSQGRGRLYVYLLFVMAALLGMLAYLAMGPLGASR